MLQLSSLFGGQEQLRSREEWGSYEAAEELAFGQMYAGREGGLSPLRLRPGWGACSTQA